MIFSFVGNPADCNNKIFPEAFQPSFFTSSMLRPVPLLTTSMETPSLRRFLAVSILAIACQETAIVILGLNITSE
jgi:hypothetical protein